MLTNAQLTNQLRCRSGISAIEAIVCVSLIAVLLALALPGIQQMREQSRRMECASRIRGLALGILACAETRGALPAGAVYERSRNEPWKPRANWVTQILPWIDQQTVAERIDGFESLLSTENSAITNTHLAALVCPSDVTTTGGGDLSFAVNGGLADGLRDRENTKVWWVDARGRKLDLDGDGVWQYPSSDRARGTSEWQLASAIKLFYSVGLRNAGSPASRANETGVRRVESVRDGMSNTLLMAENCRTGAAFGKPGTNWASSELWHVFVTVNPGICPQRSCRRGEVNLDQANRGEGGINSGLLIVEGEAPWPNSFHREGVNIAMADGSVRFLNQHIDGTTYFNLYTPDSNRLIGTAFDPALTHQ